MASEVMVSVETAERLPYAGPIVEVVEQAAMHADERRLRAAAELAGLALPTPLDQRMIGVARYDDANNLVPESTRLLRNLGAGEDLRFLSPLRTQPAALKEAPRAPDMLTPAEQFSEASTIPMRRIY